jgi:hypothetical protein
MGDGEDDCLMWRGEPKPSAVTDVKWQGIPIMSTPLHLIYSAISTVLPPLARIAPKGI